MSYYKKNNHRKTSSSSSSSSSENNLLQNNEQSSRQGSQISSSSRSSAKKKLIYPNVPKRTQQLQQCSSINNDTIQTESQINIIPSEIQSQKCDTSQIEPIEQSIKKSPVTSDEILIIELDVDTEEENIIDRERTTSLSKHSQDSSTENKNHSTNSKSNPIIPYPIRLHIDNHIDSLNSINKTYISDTPTKSSNLICSTSNNVSMQTFENSINKFSPCSNLERRRRYSSTSTNSFLFDTPCSSFSRTTTNNTI
ncbi:unnamed protein product [Rotaria sp. Silwood1]|nr:unnamed protein product [Rotaria sp. Silwood1]